MNLTDAEFMHEVRRRLEAALRAGSITRADFDRLMEEAINYLPSKKTKR